MKAVFKTVANVVFYLFTFLVVYVDRFILAFSPFAHIERVKNGLDSFDKIYNSVVRVGAVGVIIVLDAFNVFLYALLIGLCVLVSIILFNELRTRLNRRDEKATK